MNETYLYFDQVTDRDPNGFTDVEAYFDELIVSPPTDRFSFVQTTEDFETRSSGAPTFGYGASFTVLSNSLPRDWRVSFTQSGSPAASGGLTRGARILEIDGVDFVNGNTQAEVDAIVAGLFPTAVDETHRFKLRYPDGTEREISIDSTSLAIDPVNLVDVIERDDEKIGYLHFNSFGPRTGEEQLIGAFERFANEEIDELVLDLRYNGGGLLFLAAQLGYMIAGTQSSNQIFYSQEFNSRDPGRNPVSGERVSPINFQTETIGFLDSVTPGRPLPTVNLDRVFVLTTGRSCSASEAIINGLIGIGVEAVQIGTRTCGKATGQIPTENCGTTFLPLHFRGVNANGFGDYDGGFAPGEMTGAAGPVITGCAVGDDLANALGDTNEAQFAAALNFAETGSCSSNASAKSQPTSSLKSEPAVTFAEADKLLEHPRLKSFDLEFGDLDLTSPRK
jgi:C-terminal processing protease CtpA/Prc